MIRWSDEQLMQMAEELIAELPQEIGQALENVSVIIQDRPSPEQQVRVHLAPGRLLLGLYEGVPLSHQSVFQPYQIPAAIVLFRSNIEKVANGLDEVKRQLRLTLFHEIGHHLGFNEDDLRQRGL